MPPEVQGAPDDVLDAVFHVVERDHLSQCWRDAEIEKLFLVRGLSAHLKNARHVKVKAPIPREHLNEFCQVMIAIVKGGYFKMALEAGKLRRGLKTV